MKGKTTMISKLRASLGRLLAIPMLVLGLGFGGAVLVSGPAYAQESAATCDTTNLTLSGGVNCAQGDETPTDLFGDTGIFTTVTNILLFIIGAIAVIMLVIGGIRYTTSNGDSAQVTAAKNTIMYAIIGIIVAILAFAIVNFVVGSLITV